MPALESWMTRKAVLSGSGKGAEKRLANETSLAAYFIALPRAGEKRQSPPLNWLTKLIESSALSISFAGLIGHDLPKGGVLICQTEQKQRIASILDRVAAWLRKNGHFVKTLPYSMLV
jgi:hypothetical protein